MKSTIYTVVFAIVALLLVPQVCEVSWYLGHKTRDYLNSNGVENVCPRCARDDDHTGRTFYYVGGSKSNDPVAIKHPYDEDLPCCKNFFKDTNILGVSVGVGEEVRGLPEPSDVRRPVPELPREADNQGDEGLLREPQQGRLPGQLRGGDHADEGGQSEVGRNTDKPWLPNWDPIISDDDPDMTPEIREELDDLHFGNG